MSDVDSSIKGSPRLHHYKQLLPNEIRLLRVWLLGNGIHCHMTHGPLKSFRNRYYALSYEWLGSGSGSGSGSGPSSGPSFRTIIVNRSPIRVRENLYLGFQAICRRKERAEESRLLWVDAICINQSDLEERNRQVGMMGDIYLSAHSVYVWLGPAADFSDDAFDLLYNVLNSNSNVFRDARPADRAWRAVVKLHKRSYWTRLWIIQELMLGKRLILLCGSRSMMWSNFIRSREVLLEHFERIFGVEKMLRESFAFALSEVKSQPDEEMTLEYLLERSYESECDRPHDKVFGLLGLVTRREVVMENRMTAPRYSKEWSSGCALDQSKANRVYRAKLPKVNYQMDIWDVYEDVMQYHSRFPRESVSPLRLGDPERIIHFSQLLQHALSIQPSMQPFPASHLQLPPTSFNMNDKPDRSQIKYFSAVGSADLSIQLLGPSLVSGTDFEAAKIWLRTTCARQLVNMQYGKTAAKALELLDDDDLLRVQTAAGKIPPKSLSSCSVSIDAHDDEDALMTWNQLLEDSRDQRFSEQPPTDPESTSFIQQGAPRIALLSSDRIAIVPWNASNGDVLCRFADSDVCATICAVDLSTSNAAAPPMVASSRRPSLPTVPPSIISAWASPPLSVAPSRPASSTGSPPQGSTWSPPDLSFPPLSPLSPQPVPSASVRSPRSAISRSPHSGSSRSPRSAVSRSSHSGSNRSHSPFSRAPARAALVGRALLIRGRDEKKKNIAQGSTCTFKFSAPGRNVRGDVRVRFGFDVRVLQYLTV